MRALVTGGAGFIGSTLVDRLLAEGHAVDVLDNLSTGSLANLGEARADRGHDFSFHQIDVRDPAIIELIGRRRPEVVFHLAAQADVRVSVSDPLLDAQVNVLGSLHVLEGARAAASRKVVFASSGGTIYGDIAPESLPVDESHPQRPVSPYGVAKKVVGDYLFAYRELHTLEYTALALANVYGPRQDPHGEAGVVAIFAGRLLRGRALHGVRGRLPDPRLRLRGRRGRRVRAGGRQGLGAAGQHRDRCGDVGQPALRRHGSRRRCARARRAGAGPPGGAGPLVARSRARRAVPRMDAVDRPRGRHGRRARLVRPAATDPVRARLGPVPVSKRAEATAGRSQAGVDHRSTASAVSSSSIRPAARPMIRS